MSNRIYPKTFLLFAAACLLSTALLAQADVAQSRRLLQADAQVKDFTFNEELKTASAINFKAGSNLAVSAAPALIKKYFGLNSPGDEIHLIRSAENSSGILVQKYKHFHRHISVEHSAYVVLSRSGKVIAITAESYRLPGGFSVIPSLTVAAARAKALGFVKAERYAWEDLETEKAKAVGDRKEPLWRWPGEVGLEV
jgi:hypothetical protein